MSRHHTNRKSTRVINHYYAWIYMFILQKRRNQSDDGSKRKT